VNTTLRKFWKPLAGIAGLLLLVMYSSGTCRKKVGPAEVAEPVAHPVAADAVRCQVKAEPLHPRIEVVGTVESAERVNLSARLSAEVREVNVKAGAEVHKGDVLVTLDDREIAEQIRAAEAQLDQANKEYQRARQLLEVKATTEQMFTGAETAFKAAEARLSQARVMQTYARISSPIDGVVIERRVEPGDLANPGQLLAVVYDPTRLRIEAPVPARMARKLAVGTSLEIRLEGEPGTRTGRVAQIVGEIEATSRTQMVKVDIGGSATGLLPGAFGRLYIEDEARPVILVPSAAVRKVGQLETVSVVVGGQAAERLVKTGERRGDRVEILSGLAEGEVVLANSRE
jgi:membrane fusion protein, multidrug efflux system